MAGADRSLLRHIPSVDALLRHPTVQGMEPGAPPLVLADAARLAVDAMREDMLSGRWTNPSPDEITVAILAATQRQIRDILGPHYRHAINATGIVLHTGLGRAVLPPRAIQQIGTELSGYSLLQIDLDSGKRSRRDERLESLLRRLTGAEAATVVNNNAAATMLVLNTVAAGREVIVSRGQLVEIGGSFRLPDVMAMSGAKMVEVGTTNKTHLSDYERAITEQTAAILRVHPSNYRIEGFTAEVSLVELERLAHARGLMLIDDVGAGALIDFSRFGFSPEPTLPESIKLGADVTTSSADKLIGGSQGGLILGRQAVIEKIRKNPLARMLRVDKLMLAALEATLTLFLDEAAALREVPTLRLLNRKVNELAAQAERIRAAVREQIPDAPVEVIDGFSQMGSGSLPGQNLPTRLVALGGDAEVLARRLRQGEPPIVARIQDGRVLLDPRTLLEGEEQELIAGVVKALVP